MGVKSFFHELKLKVSHKRLFKALVTDSHEVLPKVTTSIKSVDLLGGHATVVPGCVCQTNFHDSSPFKYVKNRIDVIDSENYTCKFTTVEGDALGDKLEKICHELKFEASEDGGCVVKVKSEYHSKGDYEVSEEEANAGKEQASGLYKACEEYLLAHPHVCA